MQTELLIALFQIERMASLTNRVRFGAAVLSFSVVATFGDGFWQPVNIK